jgi:hypothetical protein
MSRSGYGCEPDEEWAYNLYRGAVDAAFRGKRGQAFLRLVRDAMDAMPEKVLIDRSFVADGAYCTLGVAAAAKGLDSSGWAHDDPDEDDGVYSDPAFVGRQLGIATAMAAEIMYMNDEGGFYGEPPEQRWKRMRNWIESEIRTREER